MTLVELLVVCLLFGIVITAVMNPLITTQRQAPKAVTYAQSISGGTTGLQQMMADLRNAYRINSTNGNASGTGSMLDFNAYLPYNGTTDQNVEVEYSCAQRSPTKSGYYACDRVEALSGSSLPSFSGCNNSGGSSLGGSGCTVVVDRVYSASGAPNVFTFFNSSGAADSIYPSYVQASVQVPASGKLASGLNHLITLKNGTQLPNLVST